MRFILLFTALPLLLGCGESSGPGLLLGSDTPDLLPLQVRDPIVVADIPASPATLHAAQVVGQELYLEVEFAACGDHQWSMFVGPDFGASNPPYTLLRLGHHHPTLCLSAGTARTTLRVDLTPLAELGRQAGVRTIRFEILEPGERWPANRQELRFSF